MNITVKNGDREVSIDLAAESVDAAHALEQIAGRLMTSMTGSNPPEPVFGFEGAPPLISDTQVQEG